MTAGKSMMNTILVVSVGGSCVPVVTAIKSYQSDYVVFFVSTGKNGSRIMIDHPNEPCQGSPNIVLQTGLLETQYKIEELSDPDALHLCYEQMSKVLKNLSIKHPHANLVADYTGGTKTMSSALVLAALECGWKLSLVRGNRIGLVEIAKGTEIAGLTNSWEIHIRRCINNADEFFNNYTYASVDKLLSNLSLDQPVNPGLNKQILDRITLARGFDAWDRFEYENAYNLLAPLKSVIVSHWVFLKKILNKTSADGYEVVEDLILNADRRAARGRYDDAAARLYRAMELMAQIRLKNTYHQNTGDIQVERLPLSGNVLNKYQKMKDAASREKENGKLTLALLKSYELLNELNDPLGKIAHENFNQLRQILIIRNNSFLAHGIEPVTAAMFKEMRQLTWAFVQEILNVLESEPKGIQFPDIKTIIDN